MSERTAIVRYWRGLGFQRDDGTEYEPSDRALALLLIAARGAVGEFHGVGGALRREIDDVKKIPKRRQHDPRLTRHTPLRSDRL